MSEITQFDGLLNEDQLKHWLGYERRSDVRRTLVVVGVKVALGKGGRIGSTVRAITAALKGESAEADSEEIEFTK